MFRVKPGFALVIGIHVTHAVHIVIKFRAEVILCKHEMDTAVFVHNSIVVLIYLAAVSAVFRLGIPCLYNDIRPWQRFRR